MIIPERKIEEIRSNTNIVDIISEFIQLKKRGKNYIGLCPFHNEKTPSFTVSSEKQIYHCFGCHAGGNVFKFLMDYQNISFVEAVQETAKKIGINLDFEEEKQPEQQSEQEILYDINTAAARYFSNNLLQSLEGQYARDYFAGRNIKIQTQRIFGLGYALPGWDSFVKFARENNIDPEKAKNLGLIDKKDDGGYYDKFRSRIIFPIFSPNGRVIAFGGRIMESSPNSAKYLNSPESIIYSKRRSLYGLSHSKDDIRKHDKAILVEGYIDLISLYQGGVKNVVASLGTALTEEQVQMLSRYTKNIVVFYDADPAGIKASLRSIELLVKNDFDVKIAEMPEGEDPDTFINKFGKQEFDELIKKAMNFLEYQTHQYEKQGKFIDPTTQTEAIRELVQTASFVDDELRRSILLKTIAKKFNLREKLLESELEKVLAAASGNKSRIENRAAPIKKVEAEIEEKKQDEFTFEIKVTEIDLIKLLFEGDLNVIKFIFDNFTPEDFTVHAFQSLAELVFEAYHNRESISPGALIELIEDENIKKFILDRTFDRYTISKNWEEINPGEPGHKTLFKLATDTMKKIRTIRIDREIKLNHKRVEECKDDDEIKNLMKLNKRLYEEKKLIQNENLYE
jgi:DNA primase